MKFLIKHFFSKCDQIHGKLRIWSHLLKKSLMENFSFCAVRVTNFQSFEFKEGDVIPLNVDNISPLFFHIFLLILLRNNLQQSLLAFSIIFHEVIKLRNFQ